MRILFRLAHFVISSALARAAPDFGRRASESGRLEPGDELSLPGMTDMKLGNPAVEFVPDATRGSYFANIYKKRRSLVVYRCVAHDDQILDLTPDGLATFGQRGQMLRPGLGLLFFLAATRRIGLFLGDALSLFFDAAGCGPQFAGGAARA